MYVLIPPLFSLNFLNLFFVWWLIFMKHCLPLVIRYTNILFCTQFPHVRIPFHNWSVFKQSRKKKCVRHRSFYVRKQKWLNELDKWTTKQNCLDSEFTLILCESDFSILQRFSIRFRVENKIVEKLLDLINIHSH